jgi:phospholipase/carboxylesterase
VGAGLHLLGLDQPKDGVFYVPATYSAERPAPLILMLHGGGGHGSRSIRSLTALADTHGVVLLAPDARLQSWDFLYGDYGPDVAFIDRALELIFARLVIDVHHLAINGFSDGASYALSLGLGNGDLFSHVIAFSPGFMAPARHQGTPKIYVSHGTHDDVLPIDRCSRRIVPQLEHGRYEVRYHEFEGPHTVPAAIAQEAIEWFLGDA